MALYPGIRENDLSKGCLAVNGPCDGQVGASAKGAVTRLNFIKAGQKDAERRREAPLPGHSVSEIDPLDRFLALRATGSDGSWGET